MSKIIVDIPSPEIFGKTLPRVFIDKIEIRDMSGDDGDLSTFFPGADADADASVRENVKVIAYLNIRFTKPAHIQYDTAIDFIKEQLSTGAGNPASALYLHGFTSYLSSFNRKLEESSFNLKDFIDWRDNKNREDVLANTPIQEEYGIDYLTSWFFFNGAERYRDVTSGVNSISVPLSELVSEDNIYNSKLTISNSFDKDGDEIIQISGIEFEFKHRPYWRPDATAGVTITPLILPKISDIENFYTFFVIGPQLENGTEETTFFEDPGLTSNRNTFNSFFGDITYYKTLEFGKLPSKFYTQFFDQSTGLPYYGDTYLGLDGNFYKGDMFPISQLRLRFQNLIDEYEEMRKNNTKLNKNISSLEAIIYADNNKSNMLGELSNFRSVYPDKSQKFKSGEFYNKFVKVFSDVGSIIQSYPKLTTKVLYDSLIIDLRSTGIGDYEEARQAYQFAGTIETITDTDSDSVTEERHYKFGYSVTSNDYIPIHWFQISRRSYILDKEINTESSAFQAIQDILSSDSTATFDEESVLGLEGDYAEVLKNLIADYQEAGYSEEDARQLADDELQFQTRTTEATEESGLGGELVGRADALIDNDFVVNNRGYFFFDYEKALRTISSISKYLNLTKLQKYFHFDVPYEHFNMERIDLERKELLVDESRGLSNTSLAASRSITNRITCMMGDSTGTESDKIVPKTKLNFYNISATKNANAIITDDIAKLKYGRSLAFINNRPKYSYVKFINFDIANALASRRLSGYGDYNIQDNIVYNGYRLACFEYSDWMDDDVAYKNTLVSSIEDFDPDTTGTERQEAIKLLNDDSPVTNYMIRVRCRDNTRRSYEKFREYIHYEYDSFLEYAEISSEICSYNNINNSFNQFFIDGIKELYGDNMPWIRAAHVLIALEDTLFGKNVRALEDDQFRTAVLDRIVQISPETGTKEAVYFTLRKFHMMLSAMYHTSEIADAPAELSDKFGEPLPFPTSGPDTGGRPSDIMILETNSVINFKNMIPITSKIFGEYIPDDTPDDMFNIRDLAPTCIVKGDSYFADFGAGKDNRLLSSYNPYNYSGGEINKYTSYAFEELFFPTKPGDHADFMSSVDYNFPSTHRVGIRDSQIFTGPGTALAPRTETYIRSLLDSMFRRSTVDIEVFKDGAAYVGKVRSGLGINISTRRSARTINAALFLLNLHLAESERRGTVIKDIENPKVATKIAEGYPPSTGAYAEYLDSGRMRLMLERINEVINQCISVLTNYKNHLENSVSAPRAERLYKILSLFNEDDPVGGTFNTAGYDSGLIPEFEEFVREEDPHTVDTGSGALSDIGIFVGTGELYDEDGDDGDAGDEAGLGKMAPAISSVRDDGTVAAGELADVPRTKGLSKPAIGVVASSGASETVAMAESSVSAEDYGPGV
tara:strand:+ start:5370 stop:9560 length:4191 start_codon:yes stop_codon:yes gene_type:complete